VKKTEILKLPMLSEQSKSLFDSEEILSLVLSDYYYPKCLPYSYILLE